MQLLYFAWVRERMGRSEETVTLPPTVRTVGDLLEWLAARDEASALALSDIGRLRVAVDQEYAEPGTSIDNAREIAIFPPVTGG